MEKILSEFNGYFSIVPAKSKDQVAISQKLRYQVYCQENKLIEKQVAPDELEFDEYDYRSEHCLLMYRPNNICIGTVRLILADPQRSDLPYPIEQFDILRRTSRDKKWKAPRAKLGEISRFAVSKRFKRRSGENRFSHGITEAFNEVDLQTIKRWYPHITLGLFRAILHMSRQHGIEYWYAIMEPSLIRLLSRAGIKFTAVGPLVEYHGLRQPCIGIVENILGNIHDLRYDIWKFITSEIHGGVDGSIDSV